VREVAGLWSGSSSDTRKERLSHEACRRDNNA
jgi:hypothetical protein